MERRCGADPGGDGAGRVARPFRSNLIEIRVPHPYRRRLATGWSETAAPKLRQIITPCAAADDEGHRAIYGVYSSASLPPTAKTLPLGSSVAVRRAACKSKPVDVHAFVDGSYSAHRAVGEVWPL